MVKVGVPLVGQVRVVVGMQGLKGHRKLFRKHLKEHSDLNIM
jgi:hypothetical protein